MRKRTSIFITAGFIIVSAIYLINAAAYSQHSFTVPGNSGRAWLNTRLDLPPGTLVRLKATGMVDVGAGWGKFGPEGTTRYANVPGYPADTSYRYGLVARITRSGKSPEDEIREDWSYGETSEHCTQAGGRLWLTVDDDAPADNLGEFIVSVELDSCGLACDSGQKSCNGHCVPVDDPFYGCSREGCATCRLPHAQSSCRNTGSDYACSIARCDNGWSELDGNVDNGCEFNNPNLIAWLDASVGLHSPTGDNISIWHDRQFEDRSAGESNSGLWPLPTTIEGRPAVRFGPDLGYSRKSLTLEEGRDPTWRRALSLTNTPYTIFAVVQRDSARGDNYFIVSAGADCTIGGCDANSALHLGWQSDRTIRFGQYFNDLDLSDVPSFNSNRRVISLITATSDVSGKSVSLDESGFSRSASTREGTLLRRGEPVRIGGSDGRTPPDFLFSGNVFEILIYNARLSSSHFDRVKNYLRGKYGI